MSEQARPGAGRGPMRAYSPILTLMLDQVRGARLTRRYRTWLQKITDLRGFQLGLGNKM